MLVSACRLVMLLISTSRLVMFCIPTKLCEIILNGRADTISVQ